MFLRLIDREEQDVKAIPIDLRRRSYNYYIKVAFSLYHSDSRSRYS